MVAEVPEASRVSLSAGLGWAACRCSHFVLLAMSKDARGATDNGNDMHASGILGLFRRRSTGQGGRTVTCLLVAQAASE